MKKHFIIKSGDENAGFTKKREIKRKGTKEKGKKLGKKSGKEK